MHIAGWYHVVSFGLGVPYLAMRSARRLLGTTRPLPARVQHLQSTSITILLFTAISLLVAKLTFIRVLPHALPSLQGIAAGIVMYALAVLLMRPRWRRAVERRARVVYFFMPENATERAWWIFVSVCAGVGEEITWRGVQTTLLFWMTGSYVAASVVCALSFGAAHMMQGWRSAAIITGFALGFQAIVWLSGSLYVAMAVHVAYDITAGLHYGKFGRELGYTLPAPDGQAAATVPGAGAGS